MIQPPITTTTVLITLSAIFLVVIHRSFALNADGIALLNFKFSVLSDPLHVLDSWTSVDSTPCFWRGVTCGPTGLGLGLDSGRVTGVSLPGCQLLGTIPTNIGFLQRLQSLNLSSNMINGTIPDTLFNVSTLRIVDLSGNFISGGLSESVGRLENLSVLDVSDNALGGNIPQSLGNLTNLMVISLRRNYFTGNLPLGFDRVQVIDLSTNLINGSLPIRFGGVDVQLLNLSYNSFTGDIPEKFGRNFPENVRIDLSYNNFTGEIPSSSIFQTQDRDSFVGNPGLCGPPLSGPCVIPGSAGAHPPAVGQPIPSPAIAAFPKTFASSPDTGPESRKSHGIRPQTIVWIVVGDVGGIAILCLVLFYIYRKKTAKPRLGVTTTIKHLNSNTTSRHEVQLSSSSQSSSSSSDTKGDTKGGTRWSCLRKGEVKEEEEDENKDNKENVSSEPHQQEKGRLVTVDGENSLELETLLKAPAFILGSGGSNIMYKAVLEDGTALAVRRVGEGGRFKEFEGHVRAVAKVVHPNLVRVRGFYWAVGEKLVIYEYVPGGSLANARYRKVGSSPCHISWEVRLKIAKGVARGLNHIHEKKHVHGNLKSSNILLDFDMEPKIADFGFDKLTTGKSGIIPGGSTRYFGSHRSTGSRDSFPSPSTSSIGSVSPYHPPESLRSLKPNPKWDVYSFGVLLLELVTGKVIISDELGTPVLAGLAVGSDDKTRLLRMADPSIRVDFDGREEELLTCLKLGYNCVSHVPHKRPTMKEVVNVLEKLSTSYVD